MWYLDFGTALRFQLPAVDLRGRSRDGDRILGDYCCRFNRFRRKTTVTTTLLMGSQGKLAASSEEAAAGGAMAKGKPPADVSERVCTGEMTEHPPKETCVGGERIAGPAK